MNDRQGILDHPCETKKQKTKNDEAEAKEENKQQTTKHKAILTKEKITRVCFQFETLISQECNTRCAAKMRMKESEKRRKKIRIKEKNERARLRLLDLLHARKEESK